MSIQLFANMKDISIGLAVVGTVLATGVKYGVVTDRLETQGVEIVKVVDDAKDHRKEQKEDISELKQAIAENTVVNVRQTVVLEGITRVLEKLDK